LSVQDLQRPCTAKWWGADVKLPKTLVLVAGFLFWSANQLWPHSPRAPVFNDIAAPGVGIITTVFTAFTLTRLIVAWWVRWARPQQLVIS